MIDDTATMRTAPIACTLTEREQAQRGQDLAETLFSGAEEIQEIDDGYAFRFPSAGGWIPKLAEFVDAERQCCAFFAFEIAVEPHHGPIWLRLRGGEGVKEFVAAAFVPGVAAAGDRLQERVPAEADPVAGDRDAQAEA